MSSTSTESTMSEAEFLEAQAAEAQAAIEETWSDIKDTLRETASLEVWTQRHPWLVTGAALTGGFLLASLLLSPGPEASDEDTEPEEEPARRSRPRRRGLSRLLGPLFNLMRPILGQLVTSLIGSLVAGLTAGMAASPDETDGVATNGDTASPGEGPVPM